MIQNESALQENVILRQLLDYRDSPAFPRTTTASPPR